MPRFLLLKEIDDEDREYNRDSDFLDDKDEDFEDVEDVVNEDTFHDLAVEKLYDISTSLGVNGDVDNDGNFEFYVSDDVNVLVEFGYRDFDYEIYVLQEDADEIDATTNTSAVESRINDLTLASMVVSQVYDSLRKVSK